MTQEKKAKGRKLHLPLLIFLTGLLFTFLLWGHYLHSPAPLNRLVVSNLLLFLGTLFSAAAGLLTWSLENSRTYLESEVARQTHALRERNRELEQALREIRTLRGRLPVCASCKKIRDDHGSWEEMGYTLRSTSRLLSAMGYARRV